MSTTRIRKGALVEFPYLSQVHIISDDVPIDHKFG